ncbi:tRNA dihydrouridine(20/20a) synthase DusA [Acuticoccus kandeliae]|uniref:tRNA dihydrouridine(20/20a) synthase DusA n=1 Tax=Acuticoccus kandeliae TaxID=2073160 RepID=UPI000D3E83E6|nr:tRNA dihydrouridine(20/20a) synthase DusA [Acuticoccus kandeliae]
MNRTPPIAIAPMMDWTDRHCRVFHRRLNPSLRLFTEMVTAKAVIHGDRDRLLGFDAEEHPLVLQLGGNDPSELATASRIAAEWGYDEVNLNVGCPSDRVQGGAFGACLMREPALVGECLSAMGEGGIPVSLKCRLGVDDQDTETALDAVADAAVAAGVAAIWVHARKAWLEGLSPAQNRDIPPLDYPRVHRLKARLGTFVGINGGIATLEAVEAQRERVDGVMIGRAAYQRPGILVALAGLEGEADWAHRIAVARTMVPYADTHIASGGRLASVTRHMLGLFHGEPGARAFRRTLTVDALGAADASVLSRAIDAIEAEAERARMRREALMGDSVAA